MEKVTDINPTDAWEKITDGALLVDVRTPEEFRDGSISGAVNINSEEVEHRLSEFGNDKDREIILFCKSGGRSGRVADLLAHLGFRRIFNAGGYSDLKNR